MFRKQLKIVLFVVLSILITSSLALSQNDAQPYSWEEHLDLQLNKLLITSDGEKKIQLLKEMIRFLKNQTGVDSEERIVLSSLTKGFLILPQRIPDKKQCRATKMHLEHAFMGANDNGELKPYAVEIAEKVLDSLCNSN